MQYIKQLENKQDILLTAKILLSGIFGIFSHTLNQLIAEAQELDNTSDDSDNISHPSINNDTIRNKKKNSKHRHQPQEQ